MACCADGGTSIISIALAGADVFSEVDGRNDFIPYIEILEFPPDSFVINEGESGDELFILLSGTAKVVKGMSGFTNTLATFESSGVFGEIAFLTGAAVRTASVLTVDRCTFIKLTRAGYEKVRCEHPASAVGFIEILAVRLSSKLVDTTRRFVEADRQLNMVARNGGDPELNALRENISGALFDILGGQPDETWGRFLKLSPEDKEKALAFVEV